MYVASLFIFYSSTLKHKYVACLSIQSSVYYQAYDVKHHISTNFYSLCFGKDCLSLFRRRHGQKRQEKIMTNGDKERGVKMCHFCVDAIFELPLFKIVISQSIKIHQLKALFPVNSYQGLGFFDPKCKTYSEETAGNPFFLNKPQKIIQ